MDAYSISYTTHSRRASSRIYQDLASCRLLTTSHADPTISQLIMNSTLKIRASCPSKPPKVCIIGAGISGLRCADILLKHGFNVTIWEARDRIGGRMHQAKLSSGHTVDLGPNWIHGTDQNPILGLAKQTKTATHTWNDIVNIFDEDGDLLPDGRQLGEEMWGIIVQAFKYSSKNTSTIDSKKSLHNFFEEKVKEIIPNGDDADKRRKILLQLAAFWGAFVGSPVTTQSLKFFWLEECIDGGRIAIHDPRFLRRHMLNASNQAIGGLSTPRLGRFHSLVPSDTPALFEANQTQENLFCAGTYEKILAIIAEPAVKGASVKLLTKVVGIETEGGTARILSDTGLDEEFDEVVVTTPLGWLKRNKVAFSPRLPGRLCQAIDSIGYGSLEKVYITFPRAFWLHSNSSKEQFTGFTQFLAPTYAPDTNPNQWNQECVDLSTLPESCAHPTLLFYIYGDQSVKLAADLEVLPSNQAKEEHLNKIFKPYYSLLPNFEKSSEDCTPLSCFATTWVLDELAGFGSYSTFRTGLEEGDKDIEVMRAGLPGRSLWFAGEHTAPFVALGTVTGAYWSGEAVGRRIAEAYQMTERANGAPLNVDGIASHDGAKEVNV